MRRILLSTFIAVTLTACGGSTETQAAEDGTANLSSAELSDMSGSHTWDVDVQNSTVTFSAFHNGNFSGEFTDFDAAIKLNPDDLSDAEIEAVVSVVSIDAGDKTRNANLPKAEWFDMAAHPFAKFTSSDISLGSDGNYVAAGELFIKGISKPAELTFALDIKDDVATASGSFTIDRRDFSVGTGSDFETEEWVRFPVDVSVNIVATTKE